MGSPPWVPRGLRRALPPILQYPFIRLHGRFIRVLPCPSNEGSSTRVLVIFGVKSSWSSEGSPQHKSCWARAVSWSSCFRQNPLRSFWSTKPPAFLVSAGQAICGVLRKAPGGSAVFSEWWLADDLSWSVSQSSTFWESDAVSLDASEWGMSPTFGGACFDRISFPTTESRFCDSAKPLLPN